MCADSRVVIEAALEEFNADLGDKIKARLAWRKTCREARKVARGNLRNLDEATEAANA